MELFRSLLRGIECLAYRDFCSAVRQHPNDFVILLVDSEEEVHLDAWHHLRTRQGDGWIRPDGATDDQAHLMVQVMESWFLADRSTLANYYGQGFLQNSLPGQANIEAIPKARVYAALEHATRPTQKRDYHKTKHGFELLELIDPVLVRAASRHADRLFLTLERETR